jgi:predicted GNAT family N-acyltransferase
MKPGTQPVDSLRHRALTSSQMGRVMSQSSGRPSTYSHSMVRNTLRCSSASFIMSLVKNNWSPFLR